MQTLEQPKLENITLYYREGIPTKSISARLSLPVNALSSTSLMAGVVPPSTPAPKPMCRSNMTDAKRIFDKLVKEKPRKAIHQAKTALPTSTPTNRRSRHPPPTPQPN